MLKNTFKRVIGTINVTVFDTLIETMLTRMIGMPVTWSLYSLLHTLTFRGARGSVSLLTLCFHFSFTGFLMYVNEAVSC